MKRPSSILPGPTAAPVEKLAKVGEERDAEASGGEEGFGVCVDLGRVFSDERARCWVWAERARPVGWLVARLRARLALPARLALLHARGLLLPHDPLALLRPGDTLRVIPVTYELFDDCNEECVEKPERLVAAAGGEGVGCLQSTPGPGGLRDARSPSAGSSRSSSPAPRAHSPLPQDDSLTEVKRRALALLEQYAAPASPPPVPPSPPPPATVSPPPAPPSPLPARRRRRVRRRPRRTVSSEPSVSTMVADLSPTTPTEEAASDAVDGGAVGTPAAGGGARGASVTRNPPARAPPPAPRLVRALAAG